MKGKGSSQLVTRQLIIPQFNAGDLIEIPRRCLKPNTHRRRDETVESRRVGGVRVGVSVVNTIRN